jgi:undecaprenyl-diphosphatase
MTPLQAIALGIIQGLSEFLPISSSAHLTLAPWFFGWEDPGLAFDVALHFGTLLAVLWYFRMEWLTLIKAAFGIVTTGRIETPEKRKVIALIVATIPGAIGGYLLQSRAETAFRSPELIAIALIVMGLILWAVDKAVDHHFCARPALRSRKRGGIQLFDEHADHRRRSRARRSEGVA